MSVLPVANTVYAASVSVPLVTPFQGQLASNSVFCSYDETVKSQMVYQSLISLPVTRLLPYLPQTIASAKEAPTERTSLSETTSEPLITQAVAPTNFPIATPTPTEPAQAPIELATAAQTTTAGNSSRLNADVLFQLVNAHRASIGLAPFQQDPRVQAVATSRAPELDNEIYGGGGMHAGFYARNLGYWATENMISMDTEQAALNWWLNSPVHRSAIEGDYQYAAVGCGGRSCDMIFTNFAPK